LNGTFLLFDFLFQNDRDVEIQELTNRLTAGASEYKCLFQKCFALERQIQQNNLTTQTNMNTTIDKIDLKVDEHVLSTVENSDRNQMPSTDPISHHVSIDIPLNHDDEAITSCPMCLCQFPADASVDYKNEHIEHHFD
jgi:hypothetical protein